MQTLDLQEPNSTNLNVEFSRHIQTATQKTDIIALSYSVYCNLVKKDLVVGGTEDIVFAALPEISKSMLENGMSWKESAKIK